MNQMKRLINNEFIEYETNYPEIIFNTNATQLFKYMLEDLARLLTGPNGFMILNKLMNNNSVSFSDFFDISADFETAPGAVNVNFEANDTEFMSSIREITNRA